MDMRNIILGFKKQFAAGFDLAKNTGAELDSKKIKNIFICGMGGSALPGELLQLLTNSLKIKIPVFIHRNYEVPLLADENSLIVAISYSGNTEETISSFKESLGKKLNIIAISSGGEIEKLCKENGVPLSIIPPGLPPRMALGYQFSALLKILENSHILPEVSENILNIIDNLDEEKLDKEGRGLSEKILGKIPLIYSSQKYEPLAFIFKILLNENSKMPAFWNKFPELDHNEIEAFNSKESKFTVLILKSNDENDRVSKRMDITADIIKSRGSEVNFIEISGKTIFEKIINSLILFYWTSYYLAKVQKINPFENKLIDELKNKMKE